MKTTLKSIRVGLIGLVFFAMTACGGGGLDADAKKAAELRCKMVELQNNAKKAVGADMLKLEKEARAQMKLMNEIRKKYLKGDKSAEFDKLFDKFKAECGG